MEINHFISKKRLIFFVSCLVMVGLLLVGKYAKEMLLEAKRPRTVILSKERGAILDRNGKALAAPTTLYNVYTKKNFVADPNKLASVLAPVLDMSEQAILDKIRHSASDFLYLKKKLIESEKNLVQEAIKEHKLKSVWFETMPSRTYSENKIASTVVGYMGDDGKGLTGIEYSMQAVLSPDEESNGMSRGYTVVLTIDSTIQYLLQKIAEKTRQDTNAESVIFLAADAKTGEILAYVNEPSADLADFSNSSEEERFDRPAYFMYEPGSVFKIFTMASFLDLGAVRDGDMYTCDARFVFNPKGNARQHDITALRCLRVHGAVSPRDIIRFSCNDGMAQIAEKIDAKAFADKLYSFGFGQKTGIELPGEASGIFAPIASWSARTKHTIAIGQEIAVTSLQIMQAATAFTNRGKILKLTVLSEIRDADGLIAYRHKPKYLRQVISPEAAQTVLGYMQTAADDGTGFRASIKGVPIAVKTGTAQMAHKSEKGYSTTDYLSSCIGIFPVDDPKIILYTAIIRPVGQTYGSLVAAPAISEAANAIIDYRGMGRTNAPNITHTGLIQPHKKIPIELGSSMPNLIGTPKRLLVDLLNRRDITVRLVGDGYVVSQRPEPGTPVSKGMAIELTFE